MTGPRLVQFHVGIGKTGSSYVQSALGAGRARLDELGITYPIEKRAEARARVGRVTSGNLRPADSLAQTLARYPEVATAERLLFSNESLHLVLTSTERDYGAEIRAAFPEARLEFLCYIRDPVEHAVSAYQQVVKRNGFTGDCATFLRRYDRPQRLLRLDEAVRAIGGTLTIRNYSRHRDRLLATFEDWLGLPAGTLPEPARPQINRSLTRGELELQRAFNQHLGLLSSQVVSDPLCEHLPDITSQVPAVPRDELAAFIERMDTEIADPRLQALVPAAEAYRVGTLDEHAARFPDPDAPEAYSFTRDQIDILARAMSFALTQRAPQLAAGRKGAGAAKGGPARADRAAARAARRAAAQASDAPTGDDPQGDG